MLNNANSENDAVQKMNNSFRESKDQMPLRDNNKELFFEGTSEMVNSLPDMQDARKAADTAELVGDSMVLGGAIAAPSGPIAASTVGVGAGIAQIGIFTNVALDLIEGDFEKLTGRIIIEALSGGFGSMVKKSRGDKVVEELTKTVEARSAEATKEAIDQGTEKE